MNEQQKVFLPTSIEEVFAYVVEFAQHLFVFPAAALASPTAGECKLQLKLKEPVGESFIEAFKSKVTGSIRDLSGISCEERTIVLDFDGSKVNASENRPLKSYFACPLALDDEIHAVFAFASNLPGAFTPSSIQLVSALSEHYSRFLSSVDATLAQVRHKAEIEIVEEKLRAEHQLVEKLRKLDELKSGFMSTVTHELRTPMTAVKSSIQLILDGSAGPVTQEQVKWLDMAMRNIDRLSRLIHDVLDMSRIERGRLKLDLNISPLRPLAEEVVASLQQSAADKGSSIELGEFDSSIECYFDRDAIAQVLTNLIGNAISHNPPGAHVRVTLDEVTDVLATTCVSDDGKGIPFSEAQRIFDKFHQIGKSLEEGSKGTGLGLAISRGIIEAHGGRIWCESTLGKGSAFRFSLARSPESVAKIIRQPKPVKESEILFGKIAILLGYAQESHVEECVRFQAEEADPASLGDIMVGRGILTNEQRKEVLKIQRANLQGYPAYDPVRVLADVILGRLAVKFKRLTQKQVNECVRIQASRHSAGQDCRIGEVFVEKGYLSVSEVLDILSLQGITVMSCPDCGAQLNLFYYSPINDYWCKQCGAKLAPLQDYDADTTSD